jgi:hypothetical protein
VIYNKLGSSGVEVSAISFGAMRWPDADACREVINRGLDAGMNYVDTSTGYCGGKSEVWTCDALKPRRDEIYVSDKIGFDRAAKADEVRKAIDASLERTGMDYFDFWQLWGLQRQEVLDDALGKGGWLEGVRKAQSEGLIRHGVGFTFHGAAEVFRAAVDSGEFVSATVSYNLIKRKEEEQIAYAGAHGVGIIIMNPLAGGVLGLAGHDSLGFLRGKDGATSYGALRFLLANRNISAAIVGFRAPEEVDENVAALTGAEALDEDFRRDLMARIDSAKLLEGDFCTGCGYCKECPSEVHPNRFMEAMRDFAVYGVDENRLADWLWSRYPHSSVTDDLGKCIECGLCETKCPQHLKIIDSIRTGKEALGVK